MNKLIITFQDGSTHDEDFDSAAEARSEVKKLKDEGALITRWVILSQDQSILDEG